MKNANGLISSFDRQGVVCSILCGWLRGCSLWDKRRGRRRLL